jgi:hypothetical protein
MRAASTASAGAGERPMRLPAGKFHLNLPLPSHHSITSSGEDARRAAAITAPKTKISLIAASPNLAIFLSPRQPHSIITKLEYLILNHLFGHWLTVSKRCADAFPCEGCLLKTIKG